ncbi:hypothetical protein OBV_06300 [Oscillibacter valericigenes Sjm18-20]|nr:hypothetical protein OBV_06300 [Oscillibacter valericigenes Sjm18-20]
MQQQVQNTYDYRQYDRVWQRVAPTLDPYPGMRSENGTAQPPAVSSASVFPMTELSGGNQSENGMAQPPTVSSAPGFPMTELSGGNQSNGTPSAENLSVTEENSCCMGPAAMKMIEVLQGFIEAELADRRYYLAFSRQAPGWARQTLRDTAEDEGGHARRLTAIYYLITGQCYQPAVNSERIYAGQLCPALRVRYHAETCGGLHYAQAADGTTDPCLAKLLNELSEDEYRHAERMLVLLERGMKQQ